MKEIERETKSSFNPLDSPSLDVKQHFKSFIKSRSIEELIAVDNKLFSEVRNLESEKHILVTQNYKKFVSATETINTIKTSLVGFEKDLLTLQNRVQNLVGNYNVVNSSIESKLKESQNIYSIKKDLKRLKFISDLPRVLESQLNEYLTGEKKISNLEKSLNYYDKCKEFLIMHKDNSIVKGIYKQTSELINQYRNYIQDSLHFPDFNESNLETFEMCLSLLVKIEDDKSELITTFLDRFKYLISKHFDEIFGMREGVHEIDFKTYSKIYDNYEFSINENEFLFYEHQIGSIEKNNTSINSVQIKNISSKYFKKGTFIWINKKLQENVITNILNLAYKYFIRLFGKNSSSHLSLLLESTVDLYFRKVKSLMEKSVKYKLDLDPVFFKEGILCFYHPFCEVLQKINDTNMNLEKTAERLLANNVILSEHFFKMLELYHSDQILNCLKQGLDKKENKDNKENKFITNISDYTTLSYSIHEKVVNIICENISLVKKLDLSEIYNIPTEEGNVLNSKKISYLLNMYYFILKSSNTLRFDCLKNTKSSLNCEEISQLKNKISEVLSPRTKEKIYTEISLCKIPILNSNSNVSKVFVDKLLNDFPSIRNNKLLYNELRTLIDKEILETLNYLYDSLVQIKDKEICQQLNPLFYSVNWLNCDKAVTFRLELRDLCYDLYLFKQELNDLLEMEKKNFEESNSSSINETLLWNKKQKRLTKYQKEMECLHIRRLTIYSNKNQSPQCIMFIIAKMFFKTINELVKFKKFSKAGFQQMQLDMNLIKYFFRENIIIDLENILDGFFLEIMKNCSFNTNDAELFDESLISGLLEENRKEFADFVSNLNKNI